MQDICGRENSVHETIHDRTGESIPGKQQILDCSTEYLEDF